jgi:hypothetical protein
MKCILSVVLLMLFSCQDTPNADGRSFAKSEKVKSDTSYIWKKLLDSAEWRKNYNFQMFSQNDTIWIFHPDGTWYSTNGKKWIKSQLSNSIYNLAFLDYVQFNGAIYGLGYFKGNIEQFEFKPEIFRTTDFKHWTIIDLCSADFQPVSYIQVPQTG